jgi:hypothetical protein
MHLSIKRIAFLTALALVCTQLRAADETEPGFTSLFNGKDLTGWVYHGQKGESMDGKTETPDKRMEVKDGIIIANVGKGIRDLYTKQQYNKDFVLKMEFRAAPKADSGVYIRGNQLQVRDYPTVGPYKKLKNFKDGDWNLLEIIVTGNTAECKCNGEVLEKAFKIPAKGAIGLQAETGKFEFRNVRIKEN